MSQVHKENLTAVDNALPNRAGLEIEIFGMEGIPEEIVLQHNQRVLTQFHQTEAERRAATGNTAAGGAGANPNKKPKTEDISDLKKRLAEHKAAKLLAENGGSSGSATPTGAGQSQTSASQQATYQAGTPFGQYQQAYAPPPSTTTYGQPQTYSPVPPAQPPFQAPAYGQPPMPGYGQPPVQQPYQQPTYAQPPHPAFQPPVAYPPPFSPPPFSPPPFQNQGSYPGQQYLPHVPQNGTAPFPGQPVGPPRPFGAGSPVSQFPQQQRTQSPAQNGLPQRTGSGSLPTAPGLPQRPAVGAPPVNAFQFQQMHQGQLPTQQSHVVPQPQYNGPPGLQNNVPAPPGTISEAPNAASINDLISSASKVADAAALVPALKPNDPQSVAPIPPAAAPPAKDEPAEEKTAKKDKEKEKAKQTRLVYSDNEISPEEKLAMLPKYAFTPRQKGIVV